MTAFDFAIGIPSAVFCLLTTIAAVTPGRMTNFGFGVWAASSVGAAYFVARLAGF